MSDLTITCAERMSWTALTTLPQVCVALRLVADRAYLINAIVYGK